MPQHNKAHHQAAGAAITYIVRVYGNNKSAEIIQVGGPRDGYCHFLYSGISRRADAVARIAKDGWRLAPGEWTHLSPPDGYQHPVELSR